VPKQVMRTALRSIAGRHWIVALAALKCFSTGLVLIGLPMKLQRLGWTDWEMGLFWATNAATYSMVCVVYSLSLERMALRRMMVASCLVASGAMLGLAATDGRWALFALIALLRAGEALYWPSLMAWIGESDDKHLVGDMSAFNCAWTVAMTVGFVLGGVVEARWVGLSLFAVVVVNVGLAALIPLAHIRGRLSSMGTPVSPPTAVILPRRFLAAGWVAAGLATLSIAVPGAIFVKLNADLGYGPSDFGVFFGLRGGVQAFVFLALGVFQGWRYRRWPLVGCLVLCALGSALLVVAGSRGLLALAFVLLGLGMGLGYSLGFYYSVHGRRQPKRNAGFFETVIGSQTIVGGPLGGWLAGSPCALRGAERAGGPGGGGAVPAAAPRR
jgi:MFS family permease